MWVCVCMPSVFERCKNEEKSAGKFVEWREKSFGDNGITAFLCLNCSSLRVALSFRP